MARLSRACSELWTHSCWESDSAWPKGQNLSSSASSAANSQFPEAPDVKDVSGRFETNVHVGGSFHNIKPWGLHPHSGRLHLEPEAAKNHPVHRSDLLIWNCMGKLVCSCLLNIDALAMTCWYIELHRYFEQEIKHSVIYYAPVTKHQPLQNEQHNVAQRQEAWSMEVATLRRAISTSSCLTQQKWSDM